MFSESGIEGDQDTSNALSRVDAIVIGVLGLIVVGMLIWGMV